MRAQVLHQWGGDVVYETVATVRYGRTLGKRWMKIRAVTDDGHALGLGRALARSVVQSLAGFLSWLGLLDPLWCLWDADRQCLHDKIVGTLVVNWAKTLFSESFPQLWLFAMGGLFILVVLAFPRGLAGLVTDQIAPFIGRLGGARPASPSPAASPAE